MAVCTSVYEFRDQTPAQSCCAPVSPGVATALVSQSRNTKDAPYLKSVRNDLSINIVGYLLDNANGDGFDEISVKLGEGS